MVEDFEYTDRIRRAGFGLVVRPSDSQHGHLGAAGRWRHYYQARNLLRVAIIRRSPLLGLGWAVREAKINLVHLARGTTEITRARACVARWTHCSGAWARSFDPTAMPAHDRAAHPAVSAHYRGGVRRAAARERWWQGT